MARASTSENDATRFTPSHQSSPSIRVAPKAGDRIGKYVIDRIVGTGGMGLVVSARNEQLGEVVAIKLLHPKAAKDEVQAERFVREARATVRIKSEHVVRVLDAGTDERSGALYLVMEYLDGQDIGRILETRGPMAPAEAVDTIMQVCEAVAEAHALGIVHRDLKPSNFFLARRADGSPLVKVLDFGISRAMDAGDGDGRLTETQASFGSPTYMSPEQIRSTRNADERSDVWSLGVALFEMLTGRLPFVADNVAGILASIVADAPFRIAAFAPEVPEELEATVLACLEKDPKQRVPSVAALAERLRPYASAEIAPLASRISRIKRGSQASLPPGDGASDSAINGARTGRLSNAPAPIASARPPRPSSPPPTSYGTTGIDLADHPPRPRRWSAGAIAGIAVAAIAAGVVAIGAVVVALGLRTRPQAAPPAPVSVTIAAAPPPALPIDTAPPASVEPVKSAAPAPSAPIATATTTAKKRSAPVASAAAAKSPPAAPEPPKVEPPKPEKKLDPTGDRF